jgi:TnpA family transposase
MLIGYARVSTNEQDTTAQASALKAAGCERIFREKATGGRWNRPELQRLLDHLRKGDVLVVWKLDRLSRSLRDVLSDQDLSLIRRRRGAQNRLGLAVQLALLRYPGRALLPDETPPAELLTFLARQLGLSAGAWTSYAERDETRREHLAELQLLYGLRSFGIGQYRSLSVWLMPTALQTNRGAVLVRAGIDELRRRSIVVPRIAVLERLCAEVIVRSERLLFETLTADLSDGQRRELDVLFETPRR